jgi:DNA-directed RNA polymerase specialized sigma subunit
MERGNYEGVLFNTRNAVTNYLTEFVLINDKAQRVMRNTLKEELTQKAPLQAVGVYEVLIKQVEKACSQACKSFTI